MDPPKDLMLVLSGGNALGAYHAGAYEAIAEHNLHPSRVVGTSIGAVTAAIIAGSPPEARVDRLHAFWHSVEQPSAPTSYGIWGTFEPWLRWEKWSGAIQNLLAGRPGLFVPDAFRAGTMSVIGRSSSLLDSVPSLKTLRDLVDFDRLNGGDLRFTILAVDVETGEDVVFDNQHQAITPEHGLSSASMPILFEPIEIDGRWLVDGGMSANLPIRVALGEPPKTETLCIALDLLPAAGSRPSSVGGAAVRAQDLIFACQSRLAIQALRRERELHIDLAGGDRSTPATTTLIHLSYSGEEHETAIKAIDFTKDSIRARWACGKADMTSALAQLETLPPPVPGSLTLVKLESNASTIVT